MGNIGWMELVLVLVVALVIFGPGKLPEVGKAVGKGISEFKGAISGMGDKSDSPTRSETQSETQSETEKQEKAEPAKTDETSEAKVKES